MVLKNQDDVPCVSVIVPCYNQGKYLEECLHSVFEQTFQKWECIIVNDGSDDSTHEVAQAWLGKDNRFKYIHKKNGGLSSARNAGLAFASGEFIQLLDADDLLERDKLNVQIIELQKDNEIDASVSGYRYFEDNCKELKIMGHNNFLPEVMLSKNDSDTLELLKIKNPMVISAPIYRKSVFEKVGFFDEELVSLEDWDFHTRCVLKNIKFHHIGNLNETRTLIRLHSNSMMRNKKVMEEGYQMFLKKRNDYDLIKENVPFKQQVNKVKGSKKYKGYIKLFLPPIILNLYRYIK